MPCKVIDLTDQSFGRLRVLSRAPNGPHDETFWFCQCSCGTMKPINSSLLRAGITRSCGCLSKEVSGARWRKHGLSHTPTYHVYHGMLKRCYNPRSKQYEDYGGRGITVEWKSFEDFYADMGPRPTTQHMIERLENDGPYSKTNCIWAVRAVQQRNRRNNVLWTYNGITQCVAAWAETTGIKRATLRDRYFRYGWSLEQTLTTPTGQHVDHPH